MSKTESVHRYQWTGYCQRSNVGLKFVILVVFLTVTCLTSAPALAQRKYSPNHPDVKAMVDRAVATLGDQPSIGEATLVSLAIVEHSRRYFDVVPENNPIIDLAVRRILVLFPSHEDHPRNGTNILAWGEIYFPALALILLAELDDKKYEPEIQQLLDMLVERQRPSGAFTYLGRPDTADTSQSQFAALAMSVAKSHNFEVNLGMAKNTLEWFCDSQQSGGTWIYMLKADGRPETLLGPTLSMQAAGSSSVYLLADLLQLNRRAKTMSKKQLNGEIGLPRTVSVYIPPADGTDGKSKEGPLVDFDNGKLRSVVAAGNISLGSRFTPDEKVWSYYYLYAVERYAYFREQAEGDMGNGPMATWYDDVIEFFKTSQSNSGAFTSEREQDAIATSFAILFMVQSSEIINKPPGKGLLNGDIGFAANQTLMLSSNGTVQSISAEKDLGDLLDMLKDSRGASQEQLALLSKSLKKQIVEFRNKDNKSRVEIKLFLRSMVKVKNYYRRLVAVRFLAGEQDMDNVPALLYALGDPDLRICLEAHDGLRLISRKLDSISISDSARKNAVRDPFVFKEDAALENSVRLEFTLAKKKWTDWFLKIRPGAELLD